MKRILLTLVILSGISLQAMDKKGKHEGSKEPIKANQELQFVGPNLEALPNWKRVLYLSTAMGLPWYVSLVTANTRYRLVGPLFGAACAGGLLHKFNQADRGRIPAWQTHPGLMYFGAFMAAASNVILQLSNTPGINKLSLAQQLALYFMMKRS